MCNRDSQRVKTVLNILKGSERVTAKIVLQELFSRRNPPQKVISTYTCDANGDYDEVQVRPVLASSYS